jgi:hypothetical protein
LRGGFLWDEAAVDFLKNLVVNLHATGPAAVLVAWVIAVAAVGIFGTGTISLVALLCLWSTGGLLIVALGSRTK